MFATGPEDRGSIPGWVIPKMVLDSALFNTQIKDKLGQFGEKSSIIPDTLGSKYWKGSPRVALDFGHQLYLLSYTWYHITVCKLVIIIRIIVTLEYVKPFNCEQIIWIKNIYLKP